MIIVVFVVCYISKQKKKKRFIDIPQDPEIPQLASSEDTEDHYLHATPTTLN